jgi:hypothetical protein
MARGNKPVPNTLDAKESIEHSLGKSTALVPFGSNKDGQTDIYNNECVFVVKHEDRPADPNMSKTGKQVVYGDLELGNFDEEISGINLSKLFSVYAP